MKKGKVEVKADCLLYKDMYRGINLERVHIDSDILLQNYKYNYVIVWQILNSKERERKYAQRRKRYLNEIKKRNKQRMT